MSSYSLNLSSDLLEEVQQLAQDDRLSLDQWLLSAIAQKIEAERTRKLFQSYAEKADVAKFNEILARVPDVPPIPGDEL
jgi:predicted transcriptional regulator